MLEYQNSDDFKIAKENLLPKAIKVSEAVEHVE